MTKDLHSGRLYWPDTLNEPRSYPPLQSDKRYSVAIIGGGMSGAICGYVLADSGIDACILERGEIAGGSTAANTGLLQYSNDIMLSELTGQIGERDAVRFYRACRDAIGRIGEIAASLGTDVGYLPRSSLYYASSEQDVPGLRKEYETLLRAGFDADYLDRSELAARYPFSKPAAIVTRGDAEINPSRFVHALVDAASRKGLSAYEHTDIAAHETNDGGIHRIRTASGAEVTAEHVIYAVGYEPEELRGRLIKASLNRTYAIATAVQRDLSPWPGRCLIWETDRPYFYMRTTPEGRILAGGLDEAEAEPLQSAAARRKRAKKLRERVMEHFPACDAPIEYDWNATFGESRDNLPFIGEDPKWPRIYYCLGYGGNGTIYSMMAADILRKLIRGESHPCADIVRLDRPTLQNA